MMNLVERSVYCPYCGESLQVLVDPSEIGDSYIEDCQVCCAPINFTVGEAGGEIYLEVSSQDEV